VLRTDGYYLNPQNGNTAVSTKEQVNALKCAPLTKTAFTLSNLSPVSSLQAHPSNRLTTESKPSLSNISEWRKPSVINTKRIVSRETHQKDDAHSRASIPTTKQRFGKILSSPSLGESEQFKQAANSLGSPEGLPENIPECSTEHSVLFKRLANEQVHCLTLSGEMGEEWHALDTIISKQRKLRKQHT